MKAIVHPIGRDRATILLLAATGAIMVALSTHRLVRFFLPHDAAYLDTLYLGTVYTRTVIAPNYFIYGFVRRGLGGTLAAMLSGDWLTSTALFTIASAAFLAAALVALLLASRHRIAPAQLAYFAAVVVVSPQTFSAWSNDIARTDMLVAGFIAWAAIAVVSGRLKLAVFVLLVGTLAHETALIFGAPLIAVLAAGMRDRWPARTPITASGLLIVGLLVIGIGQHFLAVPRDVIAAEMLHSGPPRTDAFVIESKEIATYMLVAGVRGIKTAICYNTVYDKTYFFNAFLAVMVVLCYARLLLLHRAWVAFAAVTLLPLALMFIVATDVGRWLSFAVVNAWLLAVCRARLAETSSIPSLSDLAVGGVLMAVLLACGTTGVYRVNHLLDPFAEMFGVKAPTSLKGWFDRCDPTWRDTLRPAPAP